MKEERIKLRERFYKETNKVATDNISAYADWLECRLTRYDIYHDFAIKIKDIAVADNNAKVSANEIKNALDNWWMGDRETPKNKQSGVHENYDLIFDVLYEVLKLNYNYRL